MRRPRRTTCLLDDVGLSIGLLTLPFQREHEFYAREILRLFKRYRGSVIKHFDHGGSSSLGALYQPTAYYLLGRFDLAVLYLVDDHDFSCRTLRAFHPDATDSAGPDAGSFIHKVLSGPTPRFRRNQSIESLLFPHIAPPPLDDRHKPPLIVVTQVKLNNSLLLGGGATFLRLVINYIKQVSRSALTDRARLIIVESHAWHEVTLVILGRSYSEMLEFVRQLRDAQYGDLREQLGERARSARERAEVLQELSSLSHLVGPGTGWTGSEMRTVPLFGNFATTLGFDFDIYRPRQRRHLIEQIDPSDRIHLLSRWIVSPGRSAEFRERLIPDRDEHLMLSVGRSDVWFPESTIPPDALPQHPAPFTRDVIDNYVKQSETGKLSDAVQRRYTLAVTVTPNAGKRQAPPRHFIDNLIRLKFTVQELRRIDLAMRRLKVPKVLIHRLLNVYANFNDGIVDRSLYPSFAEMRPFLERVSKTLEQEVRLLRRSGRRRATPFGELCRRIRKWSDNFERAYRNRVYNSERMGEVTDFNFSFKGGIQQVVTAFDAAYKALTPMLGAAGSFISVAGDSGVESTEYEVRLNYFHVFQPEMFFAVVGKEAANWYTAKRPGVFDPVVMALLEPHNLADAHHIARFVREEVEQVVDGSLDRTNDRVLRQQIVGDGRTPGWMSTQFLVNHVPDLLSYHVCYAGDWTLFCYWNLGCLSQTADAYYPNGDLQELEVARFLLRMRMIAGPLGATAFADSIRAFRDGKILAVYEPIAQQIERIHDGLADERRMFGWFARAREGAQFVAEQLLRDQPSSRGLPAVQRRARMLARAKGAEIAAGRVPRFEPAGSLAPFQFSQHVLYGYLDLLKRTWGGRPPRLMRLESGSARAEKGSANLLFDPLGGVFSREADTRRKLFQYRSAVTMSLWDLALKTKRDQIAELMRESSTS